MLRALGTRRRSRHDDALITESRADAATGNIAGFPMHRTGPA
jgi:hypothetical protein